MSTATVAGTRGVRPLAAISADYASALASKPASVMADLRAATAWLPKKVWKGIVRLAEFLHIPQMASFAGRQFMKFLHLVGPKAFAVEVGSSRWGQATLRTGAKTVTGLTKWAIKTTWRIVTSPIRLFESGRTAMNRVDAKINQWNNKLTPNSGTTWWPLQTAHDALAWFFSWERMHIKLIRTAAGASMAVSVTRKLIPPGPFRWASYGVDAVLVVLALREELKDTWLAKRIWAKAVEAEVEVVEVVLGAAAEADRITREAAEAQASALRKQAQTVEMEGRRQANLERERVVSEATATAEELRRQAAALEAAAKEAAVAEEAAAQAQAATVVAVLDKPGTQPAESSPLTSAPGPAVPPSMGGRTPSKQPSAPKPPTSGKPSGSSPQGGGGTRS